MFTIKKSRVVLVVVAATGIWQATRLSTAHAQDQPATPPVSAEHAVLKQDVGTWDAEISLLPPEAGAPAMKSKGSEKCELLRGGMWLVSRFEGEMMGMPFSGVGTTGYDPVEKKYVGTWIDSMSPHMMSIKGEYDAAKKTMTSTGEGLDAATRTKYTSKMISRYLDDNTRTFEMHMPGPDGKLTKMMEIKYKRRAQ